MQRYKGTTPGSVQLLRGELYHRYSLNYQYMMSLDTDKLLLNFYNEAGLIADSLPNYTLPEGIHKGWESPTCQLRGHFLGHYLSACAWGYAYMGNHALKGQGDHIVAELRRCQLEQEDGWVFSIPRDYMEWITRGKRVWAPQYTIHKTLMGLMDMYRFAGNELALTVARDAADWFDRYSARFTQEEFDSILDIETGGMMEFFSDLYEATGEEKHRALIDRYFRRKLFEPLMRGEDVLTNMHANTTIPEVLGCARAYEVLGERKYLDICRAYWDMAVTNRGYFVTGGQTCYEAWTPPFVFDDRLNEENQEHCTVYNMIRLADFLFRYTGLLEYQDYIERNYRNGILAQQHPHSGMVGYYLPMQPGGRVNWGTPTENFWCCHGTLVQAQMLHASGTVYEAEDGLLIAQYRPVKAMLHCGGKPITVHITEDYNFPYSLRRPIPEAIQRSIVPLRGFRHVVEVDCPEEVTFSLSLRIPWWVDGQAEIIVDGEMTPASAPGTATVINRAWRKSRIEIAFRAAVTAHPLPDNPRRVAFMDGPDALVGLTANDALALTEGAEPSGLIRMETRKGHEHTQVRYRITGQPENVEMIRLCDLCDERYTLYFTLQEDA